MGSLYRRGSTWWIKYYRLGKPMRESARTTSERAARQLLKRREGDIEHGVPVSPQMQRLRVKDILAEVERDYRINGKRSLSDVERRIALHLRPFFGHRRCADVTVQHVTQYTDERQQAGATNGTINRELAILKRAFRLAEQGRLLATRPHIPMLKEATPRPGFFEREQFEALHHRLPAPLQSVAVFAYLTGWRIPSEVLTLEWRQVDFAAGIVRLEPGTTKNAEAREFPFGEIPALRTMLETQRADTQARQKTQGTIIPWVFHRKGKPIRRFSSAWHAACLAVGLPGRIPHDFRRTAVRNLVRAGVPDKVAMQLTGHKTRAVFDRYNIVSGDDVREAARKLAGTIAGTWAISRESSAEPQSA